MFVEFLVLSNAFCRLQGKISKIIDEFRKWIWLYAKTTYTSRQWINLMWYFLKLPYFISHLFLSPWRFTLPHILHIFIIRWKMPAAAYCNCSVNNFFWLFLRFSISHSVNGRPWESSCAISVRAALIT